MDRRKMLGSMALAGLSTALPFKNMLAQTSQKTEEDLAVTDDPNSYKRFALGELDPIRLNSHPTMTANLKKRKRFFKQFNP